MTGFWKGAFDPSVVKHRDHLHSTFEEHQASHLGRSPIEFIPLEDMEDADWTYLDYYGLRNVARNRISDFVVDGRLIGFWEVTIFLEKAKKTKAKYLWPAYDEEPPDDFFKQEPDHDTLSDNSESIESVPPTLGLFERYLLYRAIRFLYRGLKNEDKQFEALMHRAEENPKSNHHWLLVSILIGKVAKSRNISFDEATALVLDYLENHGQLAAGRGL